MSRPRSFCALVLSGLLVAGLLAGCNQSRPPEMARDSSIQIAGSTSMQLLSEELAAAFMRKYPGVTVNVTGGGSSAGIKATQAGTADIGASSRELKPEEKDALEETIIGLDGICLIVHLNNPVDNLTREQIGAIFAGELTNWKDVGGLDAPIHVITREEGSGTRVAFTELVMGQKAITNKAVVQNFTGIIRTAVASDPYSIGYISMGSLSKDVKALRVDGIAPTQENALSGAYQICRPFIYLTRGKPQGLVKAYLDFVLGPEGQAIVGEEFTPVGKTKGTS